MGLNQRHSTKSGMWNFYLKKVKNNWTNKNFLLLIEPFLQNRHERVVFKDQPSSYWAIRASALQGSVLGALLFLIYINDLPQELNSEVKFFAGDPSLCSIANCVKGSSLTPNRNLFKIQDWTYKPEMSFNSDRIKQAQEVMWLQRD